VAAKRDDQARSEQLKIRRRIARASGRRAKVSVATTVHRSKGGQFVAHVKALPGAPYDGHIR